MSTRNDMLREYLARIQNYEDYLFQCRVCKKKFKHPKTLDRHCKRAHNKVSVKKNGKKYILKNNKIL